MIKLYMYAVILEATDGSIQEMLVAGVLPTPLEHEQATSLACQQIRESYPFADWIMTSFELADITDDALGWVRLRMETAHEEMRQARNEELAEEIAERDLNALVPEVTPEHNRWLELNGKVHALINRVDELTSIVDCHIERIDGLTKRVKALEASR